MEALRKLKDGVDPVPKCTDTLTFVQHGTVAENELFCFRAGSKDTKNRNIGQWVLAKFTIIISIANM